jgi:putative ABC transport system permease protein
LRRTPGFTFVALVTLALGIGGTTAIFSVVDGIVLRDLPYPDPDRLVALTRVAASGDGTALSPADYLDYKREGRDLTAVAGYREDVVDLTGSGDPERVGAIQATGAFFDVFSARPLLGRTFSERTDPSGGPRVAVISEGLWQRRFGGRVDAVGTSVRMNGEPTIILGVMPRTFRHPLNVDAWVLAPGMVPTSPVAVDGDLLAQRDVQYFGAIARLAPGVSRTQAQDQLRAVAERLAKEFPETNANESVALVPLRDQLVGQTRTPLLMMLGAVGVVLLIACANVASLLLARGAARRRELAIHTALGARRGRLVRQLMTESLVLAAGGGVLGLILATWLVAVLVDLAPASIPRLEDVSLDPRVALFTVVCSALVGVAFGLVPAFSTATPHLGEDLRDGGRSATTGRTRARRVLVIAEVAMALVLLIAAGLLLTSFMRLRAVDPGFRTTSLVTVQVPVPMARYDQPGQRRFYRELYERLHQNPVTRESAVVFPFPLSNSAASGGYQIVGRDNVRDGDRPLAELNAVSPGYFETAGIPLLRGRGIAESDVDEAVGVAVINRTFAEREWPGRDPLGEHIVVGGSIEDRKSWIQIVGVVGDSKRASMQAPDQPAVYLSYQQFTLPFMGVLVRSDVEPGAITAAVRSAVMAADRDLPLGDSRTIEQIIEQSTGDSRFRALLIASFALLALVLAVVGMYGLISYTVAERVPEIGVRLALGASPAQVGRLVMGQGLKLAAAGVGLGLIGALATTRVLRLLLFSVSTTEPMVYAGLALLLLGVAAAACWIPAQRAMRVDPMVALRAE